MIESNPSPENQSAPMLGYAQPHRRVPRKSHARYWVIFGLLAFVIFVAMLLPSLGRAREPAQRIKCASNLKQIGLSIQMYASEHADVCPPTINDILLYGDLTSEVFICPSSNDTRATGPTTQAMLQNFRKPGYCSYTYALAPGTSLSSLTAKHVVAYEPLSNHPKKDSARTKGINVLYGDGTATWSDEKDAKHVIAELQAGFNPPRPMPVQ